MESALHKQMHGMLNMGCFIVAPLMMAERSGFILVFLLIVCMHSDPHTPQSAQRHCLSIWKAPYKKRGIKLQLLLKSERDLTPIGTFPKVGIRIGTRSLPLPNRSRFCFIIFQMAAI
jgi:hypothetical protein